MKTMVLNPQLCSQSKTLDKREKNHVDLANSPTLAIDISSEAASWEKSTYKPTPSEMRSKIAIKKYK